MSGRSEITAVASRNSDRASTYARAAGIPHSFGGYDRMLASNEVDVFYVSLPTWLHRSRHLPAPGSAVNMATILALIESANCRKVTKVYE